MIKIFCTEGANNYADWLEEFELVDSPELADAVIFTGGEDVDPSLYGAEKHPRTYSNIERDKREKTIFDNMRTDQLAIGICRGSQFLCVMNGGKLVQHTTGHALMGTHPIITNTGCEFEITSTHHQMQYPYNLEDDCMILAYSKNRLSHIYEGDDIREVAMRREPEIVLYTTPGKPICLAIQGHPEYMRKQAPIIDYLNELVKKYLPKKQN